MRIQIHTRPFKLKKYSFYFIFLPLNPDPQPREKLIHASFVLKFVHAAHEGEVSLVYQKDNYTAPFGSGSSSAIPVLDKIILNRHH
jgi:hypothetical protein